MTIRISQFGKILLYVYIFMCFNAVDVIVPSTFKSISLFLFLGFSVFYCIAIKHGKICFSQHTKWYISFMVLSFFSMLYSPGGVQLFSGKFYLMIVACCISFFMQEFIDTTTAIEGLAWTFSVASTVLIISLYITGGLSGTVNNRLGSDLMGNANTFASMIMVAVFFQMWLLIYCDYKRLKKIYLFISVLANLYGLALSAGRKFFVIPFVFMYILLLVKQDKNGKKHMLKYTVAMVIIAIVVYSLIMNVSVLYDAIGYRMEVLMKSVQGVSYTHNNSVEIRPMLIKLAVDGWCDSPILGHGFDSFKYLASYVLGKPWYSHCNYTEMLYNGGIIMFAFYNWIYLKLFIKIKTNNCGSTKYKSFASAILICMLIYDYSAVNYEDTFAQVLIAIAFTCISLEEKERIDKRWGK